MLVDGVTPDNSTTSGDMQLATEDVARQISAIVARATRSTSFLSEKRDKDSAKPLFCKAIPSQRAEQRTGWAAQRLLRGCLGEKRPQYGGSPQAQELVSVRPHWVL